MKVLFLDIHEVLRLNGKDSPSAYRNLNKLLKDVPDLKIVVSSSLRHKGLKFVKELLAKNGVDKDRVIDVTDSTMRDDRGHHIERWIEDHEPEAFVILDDHNDMDKVLDHLVQVNPHVGLTSANIKKALDILKKPC